MRRRSVSCFSGQSDLSTGPGPVAGAEAGSCAQHPPDSLSILLHHADKTIEALKAVEFFCVAELCLVQRPAQYRE